MIGDKRLTNQKSSVDAIFLLQEFGFSGTGQVIQDADILVRLNNEVYDKLHLCDNAIENKVWRDKVDKG